jgi:hypothetical protein
LKAEEALQKAIKLFMREENRELRITINQQRNEIGMLNEDLAGRQSEINRLRAEHNALLADLQALCQQFGITVNHVEDFHNGVLQQTIRDKIFKDRLIALLRRAQTGVDYRDSRTDPNAEKDAISQKTGFVFFTKGVSRDDWAKAIVLIDLCVELLSRRDLLSEIELFTPDNVRDIANALDARIGSGNAVVNTWNELVEHFQIVNDPIPWIINYLCRLLPASDLKGDGKKIKIGGSLQKALNTIGAYKDKARPLPSDPFMKVSEDKINLKEDTDKTREYERRTGRKV